MSRSPLGSELARTKRELEVAQYSQRSLRDELVSLKRENKRMRHLLHNALTDPQESMQISDSISDISNLSFDTPPTDGELLYSLAVKFCGEFEYSDIFSDSLQIIENYMERESGGINEIASILGLKSASFDLVKRSIQHLQLQADENLALAGAVGDLRQTNKDLTNQLQERDSIYQALKSKHKKTKSAFRDLVRETNQIHRDIKTEVKKYKKKLEDQRQQYEDFQSMHFALAKEFDSFKMASVSEKSDLEESQTSLKEKEEALTSIAKEISGSPMASRLKPIFDSLSIPIPVQSRTATDLLVFSRGQQPISIRGEAEELVLSIANGIDELPIDMRVERSRGIVGQLKGIQRSVTRIKDAFEKQEEALEQTNLLVNSQHSAIIQLTKGTKT